MITLNQANNGQSIEIKISEIIAIHLDENPTTAYRWEAKPYSQGVLELTQSEYIRKVKSGVGGGGQHIFTFKALKSGSVSLNFIHKREWEDDQSAIALFNVTVNVNG
jgi:predicted secreted protein